MIIVKTIFFCIKSLKSCVYFIVQHCSVFYSLKYSVYFTVTTVQAQDLRLVEDRRQWILTPSMG